MAQLPADRTKLAQAQSNMNPSLTASSQKLKDALTEAYDTIDTLNQKVDNHGSNATLPHPDKSVTRAKLADKVIGAGQLDDAAVGQTHHQDNGIPSRALGDGIIQTRHYADKSVTNPKLADGSVDGRVVANGAINSQHMDAALLASAASLSTQAEFDKRGVNVQKFGAKGDGTADDTTFFVAANNQSKFILIPPGTYKIQNWVPLSGTIIVAYGAKISRYNTTLYGITGSSASVVITNSDIEIYGGIWDELTGDTSSWSGSILVEGGSLKLKHALMQNSWGGIFGHELQNGSKEAEHVSIDSCTIRNCQHNTYLSDIKNLKFTNNLSYNSLRDGLRTYRNVRNVIVTANHLYNNGDNTAGQSQDGMDLFIAGNTCVITNNFIYGNKVKGIDIKRTSAGDGNTYLDEKYIIANNHIFGNLNSGIEFASDAVRGYIENVTITGNHIYGNAMYGIKSDYADAMTIEGNHIYNNGWEAARIEHTQKGGLFQANTVYNNGTDAASNHIGVSILDTALNFDMMGNKVYPGGASQTQGISYKSNGICKNNNITGHTSNNIVSDSLSVNGQGEMQYFNVDGVVSTKLCLTGEKVSSLNRIELVANGTGTFNIQISKRNVDGTFAVLLHNTDVVYSAAYTKVVLDTSALSASQRAFVQGQCAFVTVAFTAGTFTSARLGFSLLT